MSNLEIRKLSLRGSSQIARLMRTWSGFELRLLGSRNKAFSLLFRVLPSLILCPLMGSEYAAQKQAVNKYLLNKQMSV